jgi:hypothetical protein
MEKRPITVRDVTRESGYMYPDIAKKKKAWFPWFAYHDDKGQGDRRYQLLHATGIQILERRG